MSDVHEHRDDPSVDDPAAEDLRTRAVRRVRKRADFRTHLLVYVVVNAFLVGIWAVATPHAFFWPIFPILGWGIGVVLNAWDVYRPDPVTEQAVAREMERLRAEEPGTRRPTD